MKDKFCLDKVDIIIMEDYPPYCGMSFAMCYLSSKIEKLDKEVKSGIKE